MASGVSFDGAGLVRALDERRAGSLLNWPALADTLYDQSSLLNAELADHRMCPGALVRTVRRGTMSCQYALVLLRWLHRAPEDFLTGPVIDVGDVALPDVGPDHRLRWDLPALHAELDRHRRRERLTWTALAAAFECSPSRLTNLRTATLADMDLTMRITQYLGRPAAAFIHGARW